MGGLAFQAFLPGGVDLSAGYDTDLLGRFNGGISRLGVGKSFQGGIFTLTPRVGINRLSAALANYEFGVPADKAQEGRPSFLPGAVTHMDYGLCLLYTSRCV